MDPTSQKMSEQQWQQAYAAYRSSRKRVSSGSRKGTSGESKASSKRPSARSKSRANATPASGLVSHSPQQLRQQVRAATAYGDLRMLIDLLAWIAIGVAVLSAGVKLIYYTNVSASLSSLLDAVVQVIFIVGLRLLAHVIVDIPDIHLFQRVAQPEEKHSENAADD